MADDNKNKLLDETNSRRTYKSLPLCAFNTHSCNKLFLFLYAVLYMLVGCGMFALALFVELERQAHDHLESSLSVPVALMLFVGLFVALSALAGAIGTYKEKPVLIKLFLCFTVISLVIQIGIGILAYINKQQVAEALKDDLMFAIEQYGDSTEFSIAVDAVQKNFHCCGLDTFHDYDNNKQYTCNRELGVFPAPWCGVPRSCCNSLGLETFGRECGQNVRSNSTGYAPKTYVYVNGCITELTIWSHQRLDWVGAICLGLSIPQIVGILLTYFFLQKVQDRRCYYCAADSILYQM